MPPSGKQLIAGSRDQRGDLPAVARGAGICAAGAERAYAAIYAGMFNIDRPYNLVPSLHVIWSTAIAMACADFARPAMRVAHAGVVGVIVASTVLVHQHHLIDVVAAFVIVFFLRRQYEVIHA